MRRHIKQPSNKNAAKSYSRRRAKSCKIYFTTHKTLPLEKAEVSVPLSKWRENVRTLEDYYHLDDSAADRSIGLPL